MNIRPPSGLELLLAKHPFSWLRERDVDLLVCAELHGGAELRRLFRHRTGATADAEFLGAWVSHVEIEGESDLVVAFSAGETSTIALVENKIGAEFQPDQSGRYSIRAQKLSDCPGVSRVVTVLFAPIDYMSRQGADLFNVHIAYEEATTALRTSDDLRSRFLADVLEAGVQAYHRGYVMIPDTAVTEMWEAFWETSLKVAPRLNFKKPGLKPGKSTWIYFRDAEGFAGVQWRRAVVAYKAERGQVDLQFGSTDEVALSRAVEGILDSTMTVVSANKSASIRVSVPSIDFRGPVEDQRAAITEGFAACERLRTLFVEHRERLLASLAE